jgi:transposase
MEVVKAYKNGEGGYSYLAKKFDVASNREVRNWVDNYKEFGKEGLLRKRKNVKYTLDFKLEVVEYYLTTEISYKDLALKLGIYNPALIASWVSKFRKDGVEGLSKPKGRPPKMKPKEEKEQIIENTDSYTNVSVSESEHIKELEKQVRYLQIENAYLKELRRLRLEETRETKKQQESSTTSEDHSS